MTLKILPDLNQVRKIYSYNQSSKYTSWIKDSSSILQSKFGKGTGVIEEHSDCAILLYWPYRNDEEIDINHFEIYIDKNNWTIKEISRLRIPTPGLDVSYCEKNWVPINDKPYHFVKWTSPTEVVRTYPDFPPRCEQVIHREALNTPADQISPFDFVPLSQIFQSLCVLFLSILQLLILG